MTYLTIINSLKFAKNLISWIPDQNIDKRNNSWFLGVGNNQSLSPFLPQHIWTSTARGQISNLPSLNLRKVWASYAQPQKRHFNTALWGWEGSCLAQNSGSGGWMTLPPSSLFIVQMRWGPKCICAARLGGEGALQEAGELSRVPESRIFFVTWWKTND